MTSEKLKPTPGPWVADNNEGFSPWTIWSRMTPYGNGAPGPVVARIDGDSAEADDSALLIAEAGTVFHECGLSPRELLEGRIEILEALKEYLEAQDALDNREYHGINAEPHDTLMRRRNYARDDLDSALAKHKEI